MTNITKYQLRCHLNNDILFEGLFKTSKDCVEAAVQEKLDLNNVDLTGFNLASANLDDAKMAGAKFDGANLNGANLSEGIFDRATFIGTDMTYACMVLSSFKNSNMTKASFAATDVTDAIISGCQFSCPSVFTTAFYKCAIFKHCTFIHDQKGACAMTRPPITIHGLSRDIVYLDNVIKIGADYIHKGDLIAAGERHLEFIYGREVANFLRPILYDHID